MLVPLKYNLRSLRERWTSALLTMAGIALVTAVFVGLMALAAGMETTMVSTGHPKNVVVMRDGPTTETQSSLTREDARIVETLGGASLVSPELVVIANGTKPDGGHANLMVRGLKQAGLDVRDDLRLAEGAWFREAKGEAVVGAALVRQMPNLSIGGQIKYRTGLWKVVGILDAQGRAYDSEVWVDLDELQSASGRVLSSIIVRAGDVGTLKQSMKDETRAKHMKAHEEPAYFRNQTMGSEGFAFVVNLITVILGLGAAFGAANTMYAFVAARVREVATLRVLGFSGFGIFLGFVAESMALAVPAGAAGAALAYAVTSAVGSWGSVNWATFTELAFNFRVTPALAGWGIFVAVMIGLLGGLLPAIRAARIPIARALREL